MIEVLRDTGLFPFQNRILLSHREFAYKTMLVSAFFPDGFSRLLWAASLLVVYYPILLPPTIASAASATAKDGAPQISTSHSTRPTNAQVGFRFTVEFCFFRRRLSAGILSTSIFFLSPRSAPKSALVNFIFPLTCREKIRTKRTVRGSSVRYWTMSSPRRFWLSIPLVKL